MQTNEDTRWQELLAQYDRVQAAANMALRALLAAQLDGMVAPADEVVARYERAGALRQAAEQELIAFAQAQGRRLAAA